MLVHLPCLNLYIQRCYWAHYYHDIPCLQCKRHTISFHITTPHIHITTPHICWRKEETGRKTYNISSRRMAPNLKNINDIVMGNEYRFHNVDNCLAIVKGQVWVRYVPCIGQVCANCLPGIYQVFARYGSGVCQVWVRCVPCIGQMCAMYWPGTLFLHTWIVPHTPFLILSYKTHTYIYTYTYAHVHALVHTQV